MNDIQITTVTPVFNGADTLEELVSEIDKYRKALSASNCPLQLMESIFVDDGSTDGSTEVLDELKKKYDWLKVVSLSRNFGQHPATIAGILHSSGDWIVTLDEDLQHDPVYIQEMLQKAILGNYDIVYANSSGPIHDSIIRDASSKFIKKTLAKITGNKNMIYFNSFRLIRGSIARAASAVSIDETYFDVALSWFTNRTSSITAELKDTRYSDNGKSGYSFRSLISHARRLLQSSNVKTIRFGAVIGFSIMLLGIIAAIIVLIEKIFHPEVVKSQGWASLIIITLLLGGLTSFLIGLVLENLSVILMQTHGKPKFFEVDREADSQLLEWFRKNDTEL